jgi:hypothetical protein
MGAVEVGEVALGAKTLELLLYFVECVHAVGLHVNEQNKCLVRVLIEDSMVFGVAECGVRVLLVQQCDKRVNVKASECAVGCQGRCAVTHEEVVFDMPHICLNTSAAVM